MLSQLSPPCVDSTYEQRWKRDEKSDLHAAIDEFYRFSELIKSLHPHVENSIRALLRSQLC